MKLSEVADIFISSIKVNGFSGIRNSIYSYLNIKREPLIMSTFPIMIQVEPTTYCNLECQMCINPLDTRNKKHLGLEEFKKIVYAMPFLKKISLVGAGEPLLNPHLFDMVSYAKSKGILIGFATNGTLLSDNVCKRIIESRTDWVNISLDSADKDIYENIRKKASLETLLKNIHSFIAMKANRTTPDISLWFVIMKDNIDGLEEIIKLASDLGVNKVSAQLEHNWNNEQIKDRMAILTEDFQEALRVELKKTKTKAKELGISFNYVNIPDVSFGRACKWPWKSCYITVEGFVTPCCLQGANHDSINFGNIFEKSFGQIWNSIEYQGFRRRLKSGLPPEICIGCPSYHKRRRL